MMSSSSSELAVRQDRLRTITTGRLATALLLTLLLGTVGRDLTDPSGRSLLALVAVIHLGVQFLTLAAARDGRWLRPVTELTTVTDVAALAVLTAVTGGTASPLGALLLTEVVAVTLLFGRWAGLRVSLLASAVIAWLLVSGPAALGIAAASVRELDPSTSLALEPTVRATLLLIALWATTTVTGWLADVIERDLRRRTEDLTVLREATPDLDPRQGPDQSAEALATMLVERLRYRASAVWLPDGSGLRLAGAAGSGRPSIESTARTLRRDDELVRAALAEARVVPVRRDDDRPEALTELFGPRAPLALIALTVEERTVGLVAVEVAARLGRGPTLRVREVRLLRMLAEQASLLLDNARLQAELADLAVTDAVTGLRNHRFLQQRLGEEIDRVSRSASRGEVRSLSVALLDLDHFKRVNDTYGHPTGDRVLATVADVAASTLRGSDVLCRYGGEEFAIILPDSDVDAARRACERVRLALAEQRFTAADGRSFGPVTASIGVTTLTGESADRPTVLARADQALYDAKQGGRDRVVHADDRTLRLPEADPPGRSPGAHPPGRSPGAHPPGRSPEADPPGSSNDPTEQLVPRS
jgi:diguanylate cyclase (GGDEF)-like protein